MKKKKLKATLAVALVAAAGLGAYRTYQDYKVDKESDLVMLNIEALTEDDTSDDKYVYILKKSGQCYKNGCDNVRIVNGVSQRHYYSYSTGHLWRTCKRVKKSQENPSSTCTTQDCPNDECSYEGQNGWM